MNKLKKKESKNQSLLSKWAVSYIVYGLYQLHVVIISVFAKEE